MSTIPGGQPAGSSYEQEPIDVGGVFGGEDDELDIVIVDDDAGPDKEWSPETEQPLRGQNEAQAGSVADGADGRDYDDERFQEQLSAERRRREDIERKHLEQQEQSERALFESERRNLAIQRDSFKLAMDGIDVRIRTTTEALKYARTDGDASAETDLEMQLQELRSIKGQIEQNMGKLPDERQMQAEFERYQSDRRKQIEAQRAASSSQDAPRALNQKAEAWQKQNRWMSDPSREKERGALMEINNALVAEGYDANTDDFFTEMSRRMAKRFPGLGVRDLAGTGVGQQARTVQSQQQRSAPPVAGARSSAPPSQQVKRNRLQLDAGDVRIMRALGIDLNDEAAKKYYAKEKFSRLRREQQLR